MTPLDANKAPVEEQAPINQSNLTKSISTHLSVCFGGYSDKGLKPENQDAFSAISPEHYELESKGAVAAIADGVSSADKAKDAAQLAVTQFISDYYSTSETWSTPKSASKVLTSLNQWLYSQSESLAGNDSQWLTTFSALILKSTTGYLFHVGDTRISQYRKGKLEVLTRDHNQKRGGRSVVLTRALGADTRLKVEARQVQLQVGDVFIMTCDGVHEYVNTHDIQTELAKLSKQPDNQELEHASQLLVNKALANGSDDNMSCLIVCVHSLPKQQLIEIERELYSKRIPPPLDVGMKLDGYTVVKKLHASTRSHLYLVEHPHEQQPFVLKVPSENFAEDAIYLQGFMYEGWVGERVNHQNIMKIKRGDANSQFLYHFCEYIDGQTLAEWMHDNPKPSVSQVREILKQIITALRVFQRLDIVHRDLKPDNIMVDAFGKVTLIDYGTVHVASLSENSNNIAETVPQGSLNFIAPETLLTMQADHRSDLFSLGVIAYQMLTGELPYKPMRRAEVTFTDYSQWHYRHGKQYRNDLPVWLDYALQQATQADPTLRYQAYSEFEADINKPNVSAVEEYENQPLMQRNPVQFWQGVSAMLLVFLIAALAT